MAYLFLQLSKPHFHPILIVQMVTTQNERQGDMLVHCKPIEALNFLLACRLKLDKSKRRYEALDALPVEPGQLMIWLVVAKRAD
jgi:hypothetical protein